MKNYGDGWTEMLKSHKLGTKLTCTVKRHETYGFFVTIPNIDFEGLVQIVDITDEKGRLSPSAFPEIGSTIECVILGFRERNHQIVLSMKPSDLAQAK